MTLGLGAAAGALVGLSPRDAAAVLRLDVTQGSVQPMPIALPDFVGWGLPDPAAARNVTQVITANLQRSGLFAPIEQAAYLERISNIDTVRFADWRTINAQALVTGRLAQTEGRLTAQFRLWDVFAGQQLDGKQYNTTPDNWRRIAHIISDAIYERLTGEKGYFDSRVVFVDEIRAEGSPRQAARTDGSGRRQRALPHARRRSGADAAVLVVGRTPSPTCPTARATPRST